MSKPQREKLSHRIVQSELSGLMDHMRNSIRRGSNLQTSWRSARFAVALLKNNDNGLWNRLLALAQT